LCFIGIGGGTLVLAFQSGVRLALLISLFPFLVLCAGSDYGPAPVFVFWALYLGLLAGSLWGASRVRSRARRVIAHIVILIAFATAYAASWYFTAQVIAAAVAGAAMRGGR
jgi:hypothetical protein